MESMTREEVIKRNRSIADYMKYTNNHWYINNILEYHCSWNDLMPVIMKLRSENKFIELNNISEESDIERVFKQVSDFLTTNP